MIYFSHFRSILSRGVLVLTLTTVGVGFVSFADDSDSTNEGNEETTSDSAQKNESETSEGDVSLEDEELFEHLLSFQRLLEEDADDSDYTDDTRCIDMSRMRHYDVLSGRFVVFEMRHSDDIYLIQLERKCPGLQKNESLTFDIRNGHSRRLCVNDHIKPLDGNLSSQAGMRGGNCRIPSLEKITTVQLLQLERGLASNRVE
ncbi:MAG: hypothetical protein F4Z01_00610 [Gammaproteobacteria bacterium]|nr:hypothetical protein [Gammaproteobacteria bacterium]MYF38999.1 hypothetical protein [Gammaproteobacteria bacterium]